FSLDGSNSFTQSPFTPPGEPGGNVQNLLTTNFTTPNQITETTLPEGWTLTNIRVQSRNNVTQPTPSGSTATLNARDGDILWVTFTDTFNGTSSTETTIVDAATGTPLPENTGTGTATGIAGESVKDTATVTFSPAVSPSTPTPTGTVTYTFTGSGLDGLPV